MRITVRYLAQLRQAAGVDEETIDVNSPSPTATVLAQLAGNHGEGFRQIVFDERAQVRPSLLLFLGDEQVRAATLQDFRDGDVLTVLAPMAGG